MYIIFFIIRSVIKIIVLLICFVIFFAKPAVDHAFNLNNYFFMVNGIKISISLILRYFVPSAAHGYLLFHLKL